jgi:phosphoribosyl 1,2-cyclic phosphodiesterase
MADAERQQFLVRFWGVRGSYPTPGPHTLRHGGNTACVEVQVGMHTLILDAGSGIIRLGEDLLRRVNGKSPLDLALFITHGHSDHLVGIPFFAPLFDPRTNLHLFGPTLGERTIEEIVTPFVSPPYFPVEIQRLPSQRNFRTITDQQYVTWGADGRGPLLKAWRENQARAKPGEVRVIPRFTRHHPVDGAILYRIEYASHCLVYATDVEWRHGCESEFLEFIEGADVLIHDAQYTNRDYQEVKQGFGHSTIEMATEAAAAAHVRQLILFHHEPTYDDNQLDAMELEARARFPHTYSAYEGLEIDLLASRIG